MKIIRILLRTFVTRTTLQNEKKTMNDNMCVSSWMMINSWQKIEKQDNGDRQMHSSIN